MKIARRQSSDTSLDIRHVSRRRFRCLRVGLPRSRDTFLLLSAAKRFERRAHLGDEKLRLFPRCKMGTLWETVVVDELGISLLSPTLRCLVNLFREGAYSDRDFDASRVEEASRQIVAGVP